MPKFNKIWHFFWLGIIYQYMEVSFQELKCKQVVNTVDGKCLGHITDVVFDIVTAKTLGFIVPQSNPGFWGLFKGSKDIFIPFNCVCKIGVDVILVELYVDNNKQAPPPKKQQNIIALNQHEN